MDTDTTDDDTIGIGSVDIDSVDIDSVSIGVDDTGVVDAEHDGVDVEGVANLHVSPEGDMGDTIVDVCTAVTTSKCECHTSGCPHDSVSDNCVVATCLSNNDSSDSAANEYHCATHVIVASGLDTMSCVSKICVSSKCEEVVSSVPSCTCASEHENVYAVLDERSASPEET